VLANLGNEIPVTVIGLGSNLIVRDGGVPGVVIRLGRGFNDVIALEDYQVRAGTAVPDVKVARVAQEAASRGLRSCAVYGRHRWCLAVNGGAYGGETKDVLISARGVDRQGNIELSAMRHALHYRHCGAPDDVIFTEALFRGKPGDPAVIAAEMDKITQSREATQPIKSAPAVRPSRIRRGIRLGP